MKLTIAVVDRQPLILQALAQLLLQDPDIHMAYSCLNDKDLEQRLAAKPVDMVIAEDIFYCTSSSTEKSLYSCHICSRVSSL